MEKNKFLNESPEQVVLTPNPRRIEIYYAHSARAYGLFDSETGTQVSEFKKGTTGQVEFAGLDPNRHYDVGAIEGMGDEKPQFAIIYTRSMRDDTDTILNNSDNLPVIYPQTYLVNYKENNSDNVFDLVDNQGDKVGEVAKLSPTSDKPVIIYIQSLKVKDDTQE